jgi:hypothetical protein
MLATLRHLAGQDISRGAAVLGATVTVLPAIQDRLRRLGQRWLRMPRQRSTAAVSLGAGPAALLVLVGAGCMYLLDPASGGQRREMIRGKLMSFWRREQSLAETVSRQARDRARDPGASRQVGQEATGPETETSAPGPAK